jgi:parallel beta-helix repeat protein
MHFRADPSARVAVLFAALAFSLDPASAATFNVSDLTGLQAAVTASKAGDVILLATGNYGRIRIRNTLRTGSPVRIEPASSAVPTATDFEISASSGFAVYGLTITGSEHPLVSISTSSDIRLGGLRIYGATNNKDAWDDENSGLWIRNSSRVSVSNTRISDVRTGIYVQRSNGIIIADSTVEFVREGLNVAAVDQLYVYRNRFQEFTPNYAKGEHPDAIQFWVTNETVGVTNVVIAENFLSLGGYKPVQGFFIASGGDATDPQSIVHERVELRHNIYYGSARNALRLGGVRTSYVHHNTVLASPNADRNTTNDYDATGRTGGGLQPSIALLRSTEGRIEKNIATLYTSDDYGYTEIDNIDVWDSKFKTVVPVESIFQRRPTSDAPALSEFAVLPGSLADQLDAGATPPSKAGVQSTSLWTVRDTAGRYHALFGNFESLFSPGF